MSAQSEVILKIVDDETKVRASFLMRLERRNWFNRAERQPRLRIKWRPRIAHVRALVDDADGVFPFMEIMRRVLSRVHRNEAGNENHPEASILLPLGEGVESKLRHVGLPVYAELCVKCFTILAYDHINDKAIKTGQPEGGRSQCEFPFACYLVLLRRCPAKVRLCYRAANQQPWQLGET